MPEGFLVDIDVDFLTQTFRALSGKLSLEWECRCQCQGGQGPLLPGVLVAWMSRMSVGCWTGEEGSSFTKYVLGLTSFSSFSFKLYDNLSGMSFSLSFPFF